MDTHIDKEDGKMRDDFLTRDWAGEHSTMAGSIHKLIKAIGHGFRRLNAIQYDAPWRRKAPSRIASYR